MAQVNNNKKTINHTWSFKPVAQKDLNSNQWPFKVVRDEGKPSKMVCRSLTDLNKSFEGLSFNLNDCPKIKSRYSHLYQIFKQKYSNITSDITHLAITFDTVYFRLKDKPELRKFSYGLDILNNTELYQIVCGYLYKSKYIEERIKDSFMRYKASNDDMYLNQLKKDIEFYITVRKKVALLDNCKYILDVLTSDISFSSLQYLVFMPVPNIAKDYQKSIIDAFMRMNIDCNQLPNVMSEVYKVPTLEREYQNVTSFIQKLNSNSCFTSIRKVYMLTPPSSDFGDESVNNMFKNIMKPEYTTGLKYISAAEKKCIEQEQERLNKDKIKAEEALRRANTEEETKKKLIESERNKVLGLVNQIYDMIHIMTYFSQKSTEVYNKAVEKNNIELIVWGNNYKPETLKNRIDAVFRYYKDVYNKEEDLYPIVKIFKEIFKSFKISESMAELDYFSDNIVPTYFKDDRKAVNLDLETVEGLKETYKVLQKVNSQVMSLYETYLGVQYASFGGFMKRYNKQGLYIAKVLVPNLVEKHRLNSFKITPNVLERANECFYMVCKENSNLDGFNKEQAVLDEKYKDYSDFVMYYLNNMSENPTEKLIHSDSDNKESVQYSNLMSVAECIYDILNQLCVLQELEIEGSFAAVIGKKTLCIEGDE